MLFLHVVPLQSNKHFSWSTSYGVNSWSILRLLFRPFMSCKENAKILMFSWEDFTCCGSCKLLHRSQIAHLQRSPADNLAWPEAKHCVCVCVWSIVLDQECKRLSTAAKLPSTLRWRVHFVLALWAACSDTNMSNQLNLSKNDMIDMVLYTCLSKS